MASLETVNDFLAQYHDIVSADEASSILRESRRYMVGGLIPRNALGFVMRDYYPIFIKFEAEPEPDIPEPGMHQGVI